MTENGINIIQGLKYGLVLSAIVFITATISHSLTKSLSMHYLPKMSFILSSVAVGIFGVFVLASFFQKNGFLNIDILPLLLMIIVSEQLISMYIKKGRKTAYVLFFGSLLFSIITYLLISWENFQNFMLHYPYLAVIFLIINLFIGRWKGFRINEYFRFKTILKSDESN